MARKVTEGEGSLVDVTDEGMCLSKVSSEEWTDLYRRDPQRAHQVLTDLSQLFPAGLEGKRIRYKITVEAEEV